MHGYLGAQLMRREGCPLSPAYASVTPAPA